MESQVQCKHILQKHTKSRNPFDRFRNKPVTRSPEEALENINRIREQIKTMEKKLSTMDQPWNIQSTTIEEQGTQIPDSKIGKAAMELIKFASSRPAIDGIKAITPKLHQSDIRVTVSPFSTYGAI